MKEYNEQANKFLEDTNTKIEINFSNYGKHFIDDTEERDIYDIKLIRGEREYKFKFGNSLNDSGHKLINKNTHKEVKYTWMREVQYKTLIATRDLKRIKQFCSSKFVAMGCLKLIEPKEPTPYDILSCLTTYDPDTFKEFCDIFGYDMDSIKANTVYLAVVEEWKNIKMLYTDAEIGQLQEIL